MRDPYLYDDVDVLISLTLSATKCIEENVLVRYTTNNWSSSSIISASGIGTSYTATIPKQSAGTTVNWYALTSTLSNPTIDIDFLTLSAMNNDGSNYSYSTFATSTTDYFRTKNIGNWDLASNWESSANGSSNWITSSLVPGASAASITISDTHTITLTANSNNISSLTISSGGTLVVEAGKQLTVNGNFTNNGTLTLKSNSTEGTASIITLGTVGGSGTTTVEQYITSSGIGTGGRNWYISSPLTAATSSTITTATGNGLVSYNVATSLWDAAATTMGVMVGYIAKSPAAATTIQFTGGSLNTGNQSVSDLPLGFNLVGNPYASSVDWAQATKTNITNSIWYRSKSTGLYKFHTYNVLGGTGVNDGTAIIPPMQSFWVKTTSATNTLGFTNSMRLHQDQSVIANRLKMPAYNTQKLLRFEIANGANKDETVVYFNDNALNTFDEYDSQKMFNETAGVPEIYTYTDSKNLVINGLNAIQLNTEIPLGFRTGLTDLSLNYTLKATQLQNLDTDSELVLIDKDNGNSETVLNEGSEYTFNSAAVNTTTRFGIVFRAKGTTTGGNIANEYKDILVYRNENNQICIDLKSKINNTSAITVYNTLAQKITEIYPAKANTVLNVAFKTGVYFVKLNIDNKIITRKVIIK